MTTTHSCQLNQALSHVHLHGQATVYIRLYLDVHPSYQLIGIREHLTGNHHLTTIFTTGVSGVQLFPRNTMKFVVLLNVRLCDLGGCELAEVGERRGGLVEKKTQRSHGLKTSFET